jgi:hypothetical protein
MTFDEAKAILGDEVSIDEEYGWLSIKNGYLEWHHHHTGVSIDGDFSFDTLEAIVVYCRTMSASMRSRSAA